MTLILVAVHVMVCIALILIVLFQTGKGADMGAAFGGGASQTLFGSSGASTFLSKATTVAAVIFMATSLWLAYLSTHRSAPSIIEETAVPITTEAESSVTDAAPVAPDNTAAEPAANDGTPSTQQDQ